MTSPRSAFDVHVFRRLACTLALLLVGSGVASAQPRPVFTVRGFGDVGSTTFTASDSFDAVLGSSRGHVFGGGIDVVERHNIFATFRASRFRADGERVFRFNDDVFGLGIPVDVSVTPIELTGGYRFDPGGWRVIPYGGGGISWHRYKETSQFATDAENVEETFTGYQLLGGAELRIWRWIGVAGEVQWTTVPDALGQDANGISSEFDETDLGGTTIRFKVVIGR